MYAAIKLRSAIDLENAARAEPYVDMLESMETEHQLTGDASEAKWLVDTLQNIASRDAPQEIKTRSEQLIRNINERLMSTYPLLSKPIPFNQDRIWEDLEAAGYTRPPVLEQPQRPHEPEQAQEGQPQPHDDDEMARTAGHLLDRVSDNTSEKFQNSQFFELMRRLRDREVRVEGDKMVEVSTAQSTSSHPVSVSAPQPQSQPPPQPTPDPLVEHYRSISPGMDWSWSDPPSPVPAPRTVIPPVDPNILDHAATDFETPVYEGEGEAQEYDSLSRSDVSENVTDEVSDQYSYYNVHSTYHR